MNRPSLTPLDYVKGLLWLLIMSATFAKMCRREDCYAGMTFGLGRGYCHRCGDRLIWWWARMSQAPEKG